MIDLGGFSIRPKTQISDILRTNRKNSSKGIEVPLRCQLLVGIIVIPALCVHIVDHADRKQIQITNVEPQLYAAEQKEITPRKKSSGQWIKAIPFPFPMYYNDSREADCDVCFVMGGYFLPKRGADETAYLFSQAWAASTAPPLKNHEVKQHYENSDHGIQWFREINAVSSFI